MDSGRNAHSCRLAYDGTSRIAASTYGDIGFEALDYRLSPPARSGKIGDRLGVPADILDRDTALEARDLDSLHFIARLRDELCLHALGSTRKEELRIGVLRLYDICDSETGVYVTARASA